MTSLLAPPSPDLLSGLHACLDEVDAFDLDGLDADGQGAYLASLGRAEARIAANRLRLLSRAEKARTAERTGAVGTAQWAAKVANADPVALQRQVGLAHGLEQRTATRKALTLGAISAEHAAVIVHADRILPRTVTPAQRDAVEAALVEKARALAPSALRRAARRALEAIESDIAVVDAHENEVVLQEEDRARAKTRLTLHDNGDGTVTGHFTVPTAPGLLLKKIVDTITAPRRGRLGASHAQAGPTELRTDWDRARGEALVELIEHLPTDHLHSKSAATVVVAVSEDVLRGALRVAGLDTGDVLSAGEVRRLACTAGIVSAVLDGKGVPLDLGRTTRLFTQSQRLALGLVHSTCAADGCDRPFAWCELHHLTAWAPGGPTDLANAVPLCHFHHRRIHDHRYRHRRGPDGSIFFTRV